MARLLWPGDYEWMRLTLDLRRAAEGGQEGQRARQPKPVITGVRDPKNGTPLVPHWYPTEGPKATNLVGAEGLEPPTPCL